MFLSHAHHVNTDSNTRFFVRTLYKNMPKIYEHAKHTEDDERRRTSILDTAQIMEISRFSAIVHPCNIAFRVVHMELCFKYFFTCYRISFLPARVAANSIKRISASVRTSSSRSPFQNRNNWQSHIINILLASFAQSVGQVMDPRFFLPCFHGPRASRLGHTRKEKIRSITCRTDLALG